MNCHVASLVAAILIWSQIIGHVGGGPIVEQGLAPSLTSKSATTLPKTQYPPPLPEGVRSANRQQLTYNAALQTEGRPALLPFPPSLPTVELGGLPVIGDILAPPAPTDSGRGDGELPPLNLEVPLSQAESLISGVEAVVDSLLGEEQITKEPKTTVVLTTQPPPEVPAQQTETPANPAEAPETPANPTETPTNPAEAVDEPTEIPASSATSSAEISATQTAEPSHPAMIVNQDAFQPLSMDPIPSNIPSRDDHPVPRLGILDTTQPIQTNKFYAGLFLGSQSSPVFTLPYSVFWSKGSGNAQSWGLAISHIGPELVQYGPPDNTIPGSPVKHYLNPVGLQSIILSATELGASTVANTADVGGMSTRLILRPWEGSSQTITFPLVQGMGFITGLYSNLTPAIQSSIFFRKVVTAGSPRPGIFKYQITLEDDSYWLLYVIPSDGVDPQLQLESNTLLRGPPGFSGIIQTAKNPNSEEGEKFFDNSAGVYPVNANVSGSVTDSTGTYTISWEKDGKDAASTPLLMFALPHHVESFDPTTQSRKIALQLRTPTKGNATAVIGESWTMVEPDLPTDMDFAPWSPSTGSVQTLPETARQLILSVASKELRLDIDQLADIGSMYFSGKILSKFAALIYTVHRLADDPQTAAPFLDALKTAFARFVENKQQWPLVYDMSWKGIVSSATYVTNDAGADFGNSYYNDHHFHYGYFIHTAAIIGALDPNWIAANKAYVNMLVRDTCNPAFNDPYFPFSRAFDWFHGHSWAKGLFESYDGKDEESTSEDVMFAYAIKMWGKTVGDKSMEARGNLMLGILKRTLRNYFLLQPDNVNHPKEFLPNKVTGILFENKVDHTTYFGTNLEYIQGIHMIPILPCSAYTRDRQFVADEWNAMFAPNAVKPASTVDGGWRGILYGNLALNDPKTAYDFFAQSDFDYAFLDGGASRVWYLAFAAGLGGTA